ncbi:hypothetical protein BKI52_09060 [marine bacterium AO1-C]|nr:hypothetical protein BKI52_09060 [marine bacterium AO1-C]
MKSIRYLFFLTLIFTLATIMQGQAQAEVIKKLITRKWQYHVDEYLKLMPKAYQEQMKIASQEEVIMFRHMVSESYMHFKSDGTVELKIPVPGAKPEKMTWKLTNKGMTLVTVEANGQVSKAEIMEVTDERLILKVQDENEESLRVVFVPFKD